MTTQFCNYTIQGELGRGGMAVVYRAVNSRGEAVALKTMLPRWVNNPSMRKRFAREAGLRLKHQNIAQILDVGECNGLPYFAMQLIEGESLENILQRMGRLTLPQALPILRGVAAGLDYAHGQGIIHRDIKPSNILIRAKDGRAVLTDFGVAKDVDATQLTSMIGQRIGTPQYMSPEQARGDPILTRASDVYALGILAYRALSGRVPFDAESDLAIARMHLQDPPPDLRKWNAEASSSVARAVAQALSKDPAGRYRSAGDFVAALAMQSGKSTPVPVLSSSMILGIAAAIATLVIGGVVLLMLGGNGASGRIAARPSAIVLVTAPNTDGTIAIAQPTATLAGFLQPTETPVQLVATSTPYTPAPTVAPSETPTPACQQSNPFNLNVEILRKLGCGGTRQNKRSVVFQDFVDGFMLVFSKPNNVWDNTPGAIIFAFSDRGQAWRVVDQFREISRVEDTWYSCQPMPGRRPENSGIPWRGFGLAWCSNSGIRSALGMVSQGSGEVKEEADYAEYANGSRVVKFRNRVYVITMSANGVGEWQ